MLSDYVDDSDLKSQLVSMKVNVIFTTSLLLTFRNSIN